MINGNVVRAPLPLSVSIPVGVDRSHMDAASNGHGRPTAVTDRDRSGVGAAGPFCRIMPTRRLRSVRVQPSCMALISTVLAQSHLSSNLAFITESGFARPQAVACRFAGGDRVNLRTKGS